MFYRLTNWNQIEFYNVSPFELPSEYQAFIIINIIIMIMVYRYAIDIVGSRFEDYAVKKQDFMGDEDRYNKVLQLIPDENILS